MHTESNRIPGEPSHTCELLVTATEDDAHTPRYDTNPKATPQARKYERPTLEPVHLRNTNECDSVGTPPHMETLQSNNKDKFVVGGEPGKLKIDDLQVLPSQKLVVPFSIDQNIQNENHLSPILRN